MMPQLLFTYMTDKVKTWTRIEHSLVQKVVKVKYNATWLGASLRCAQYGTVARLAYHWMVFAVRGGGTILYVSLDRNKLWYALGTVRLNRNIAVQIVLAL